MGNPRTDPGPATADKKPKNPEQPFSKPSAAPAPAGPSRTANVRARAPEPHVLCVPHPNELARPPTGRGDVRTYAVIVGQDVGLFFTWYAIISF